MWKINQVSDVTENELKPVKISKIIFSSCFNKEKGPEGIKKIKESN